MGDYGHMTLIKGPGYPMWIALISRSGVSLLFAQQLLYVLACVAVYRATAPLFRSSATRMALFLAVLLNPMTFTVWIATRVIREAIYPALTLLVFAAIVGTVLSLESRGRLLFWSSLAGVAIASLAITREEGIWILPLVASGAVAIALRIHARKAQWRMAVLGVVIAASIIFATHAALSLVNERHYGTRTIVEFKDESFIRAYSSLAHVRPRRHASRTPVPREVRERVYAVSPAFRELRSELEGPTGKIWAENSAGEGAPGEISGGAFMWALRDAVKAAGYYSRGHDAADEYYARLSREIAQARKAKTLDADPPSSSMLPPLTREEVLAVVKTWLQGLGHLFTFPEFSASPVNSQGDESDFQNYAEATKSRLAPRPREYIHLRGWALHVEGALEITIEDRNGALRRDSTVTRLPSPDVYEHLKRSWKVFPAAEYARFEISTDLENSVVVLHRDGKVVDRIPVTRKGLRGPNPQVRLALDDVQIFEKHLPPESGGFRFKTMRVIGRIYQIAFPVFGGVALLLYLATLFRGARLRRSWLVPILIAGLLGAVAARLLILALIHVTLFGALNGQYESAAVPLLIVASVLAAHDAVGSRAASPAGTPSRDPVP